MRLHRRTRRTLVDTLAPRCATPAEGDLLAQWRHDCTEDTVTREVAAMEAALARLEHAA